MLYIYIYIVQYTCFILKKENLEKKSLQTLALVDITPCMFNLDLREMYCYLHYQEQGLQAK